MHPDPDPDPTPDAASLDRLRALRRRYDREEAELCRAKGRAREERERWRDALHQLSADRVLSAIPLVRQMRSAAEDALLDLERDLTELHSAIDSLDGEIATAERSAARALEDRRWAELIAGLVATDHGQRGGRDSRDLTEPD